jgi:serine acetyltransferase
MKKTLCTALAVLGCCLVALSCKSVVFTKDIEKEFYKYNFHGEGIRNLTIEEGVTEIPALAFLDNKLTSLTIPDGVRIGQEAFNSNRLTNLTIGNGVTIGEQAFRYNNQLTSLTIGTGVRIGKFAFWENKLTNLTIPEGVTIEEGAFLSNNLTSLTIPEGLTIGNKAFSNNRLTSLTIPEGVTIGNEAFRNNRLTSLTIPEGVTIGREAFKDNPLTSLTVEGPVDCIVDAFGDGGILGFALMSGNYPGTFTKAGNGWLFNGAPLNPPKATLEMSSDVYVMKIDGADPQKFYARIGGGRMTYFIPPGMHTVEVRYESSTKIGDTRYTTRSQGSVTFEHRYLFEGKTYRFTGTPEGDQIIFRIVPQ